MAEQTNDNYQLYAPKSLDNKYLNEGATVYTSVAQANLKILSAYRHEGLTVLIDTGSGAREYWYHNGTDDIDLQSKSDQIIATVDDIDALLLYDGPSDILSVKDSLRGGIFTHSTDSLTDDDGLIFVSATTGYWVRQVSDTEYFNVNWWGAINDGVTDNHDIIVNALTSSTNRTLHFPEGDYYSASLITFDLQNVNISGVKGLSIIKGDFGYALFNFTNLINTKIQGITFQNDYVNATQDNGLSIVYSYGSQNDVTIKNCTFTGTDANTSGLTFYTNINTGGTNTMKNVRIINNNFTDVGRIGCTLMNRNTDHPEYATNITFSNNIGQILGTQNSYGFLLSLDGVGQGFSVNNNYVYNALGIGIENTGWNNGEFNGNRFGTFTRTYSPFSFSTRAMTGLTISDNQNIGLANAGANFIGVVDSAFSNNYFKASTAQGAFFRNIQNCKFTNEHYEGATYGLYIESSGGISTNNIFSNSIFSTVGYGGAFAVVRFSGAGTTYNTVRNSLLLKGGGGYVDEVVSATNNKVFGNFHDTTFTSYTTSLTPAQYGIQNVAMLNATQSFVAPNIFTHSNNSTAPTLTIQPASGATAGANRSFLKLALEDGTYVRLRKDSVITGIPLTIDHDNVSCLSVFNTGNVQIKNDNTQVDNGFRLEVVGTGKYTDKLTLAQATTSIASLNMPDGTAPTVPSNNDIWCASNHIYIRLNGVTYQLDQPAITGDYILGIPTANVGAPSDSTTYYIGGNSSTTFNGTAGLNKIYIPKTGTLTKASVFIYVNGTLGTAETSTVSVRLNNTTDYLISSAVTCDALTQEFHNTSMSIPVTGDFAHYIEVKWVTPAWATNPTNLRVSIILYVSY